MNGPLSWQLTHAGLLLATCCGVCQTLSAGGAARPSGLVGCGWRVSMLGEGTQRPSMPLAGVDGGGGFTLAVNQQVLPFFRLCETTLISSNHGLPAGRGTCLRQMALICAVLSSRSTTARLPGTHWLTASGWCSSEGRSQRAGAVSAGTGLPSTVMGISWPAMQLNAGISVTCSAHWRPYSNSVSAWAVPASSSKRRARFMPSPALSPPARRRGWPGGSGRSRCSGRCAGRRRLQWRRRAGRA